MALDASWEEVQLGDVAETYAGGTPSRSIASNFGGGIPWVKSGELNADAIEATDETLTKAGLDRSSATWVPARTPLVAMYGATAGQVSWLAISATTNQAVLAALPKSMDDTDPRWLYWALRLASRQMLAGVQGSGQPNLSKRALDSLVLKRPSIREQRCIAEILDTLDEAIRKTEQIIAKLKQVKQGLLHDLLTRGIDDNGELRDPIRHPKQFKDSELGCIARGWNVCPLGSVADVVDPNPSHRYPNPVSRGVPIASTENFVGDDGFDLSFSTHVPADVFDQQDRRCRFHAEDVVFARKGRLGFARPYGSDRKVFSHTVVLMKPKIGRSVHRFLLWSVRAAPFFNGIRVRMNTNLGVPTLGVGFLSSVPVATPPVSEQKQLAAILDSAAWRIAAETTELGKLRQLKKGLAEDLFTGRVRVSHESHVATRIEGPRQLGLAL